MAQPGGQATLHMRTLVAKLPDIVNHLFRWRTTSIGSELGVRRRPMSEDPLPLQDDSVLVPIATACTSTARLTQANDVAPAELAIVPTTTNESLDDHHCVQIVLQNQTDDHDWVPTLILEGVHFGTIDRLVRSGTLEQDVSEFSEYSVRISKLGLMHRPTMILAHPEQVPLIDEVNSKSKLDLMIGLKRFGWEVAETIQEPLSLLTDLQFLADFNRPLSYFNCLAHAPDIFEACPEVKIYHDKKDIYYQCLLRLRGAQLVAFVQQAETGLDEQWCRRQLQDAQEDPEADIPPLEDGGDGDDVHPDDEVRQDQLIAPLMPLVLDHSLAWKRCKAVHEDGREVKVYVDHLTGGSAKQRSYANCTNKSHRNCFLWQVCCHHANRNDLALFLFTWATSGFSLEGRVEHMQLRPTAAQIEENRPRVKFVEWRSCFRMT